MTRPLGASFADWMDNPRHLGGLALGTGPVALGLTVAIIACVGFLAASRVDVREERSAPDHPEPRHEQHLSHGLVLDPELD